MQKKNKEQHLEDSQKKRRPKEGIAQCQTKRQQQEDG